LTNLNLLRYFISADEDLPPSYVKRCRAFLKKVQAPSIKLQAPSAKLSPQLKDIKDYESKRRG